MTIEVLHGGLMTTVQDAGRYGHYNLGFPPSGAMDDFSFRVANLLVGNDENAAALETTYLGPRLRFHDDRMVAVTGAEMPPTVEGDERPLWEAFEIEAGQTLAFDHLRSGARSYIAVAGGIDVAPVMGSRSTYARVSVGGYEGRAVKDGDRVPLGPPPPSVAERAGMRLADKDRPTFSRETEVRIIVGLYDHRITEASRRAFLDAEWTVTTDADRVGYRYRGVELEFVPREEAFGVGSSPWNTCSLNYPFGVIQIPGGVEPIVLMRDGVTGGNYASVGTVINADLDRVAQSKSHDTTKFTGVSLEAALTARAERRLRLAAIRSDLVR
jgi:biotin-dependent carboxylase-like uncharacterized protein